MNLIAVLTVLMLIETASAGPDGHYGGHICFYRMDTNGDEQVSPEEFKRFYNDNPKLFKIIDQNEDGGISHEEYEEYWDNIEETK